MIQIEHSIFKSPNCQEASQLAISKRGPGFELGATVKQIQVAVSAELEPATSGFHVRRPNHSATLPAFFGPDSAQNTIVELHLNYNVIYRP